MKGVKLRESAEQDLVDAASYLAQHAGQAMAERLIDEALAALESVRRMPTMGSPRLGQLCDIPGLRSWRVAVFDMQWFYFDTPTALDVVRLLADRQDISAILKQQDGPSS